MKKTLTKEVQERIERETGKQIEKESGEKSGGKVCEQDWEEVNGKSGVNVDKDEQVWGESSKTDLIQRTKKMLDWYTFQASDEEFNVQEVEALVSMLRVMDSQNLVYGQGKARDFEQLLEYRREKLADAEKLASLCGSVDAEKTGSRHETGRDGSVSGRKHRKLRDTVRSTGVGAKLRNMWSKEEDKKDNKEDDTKKTGITILNHHIHHPIMAAGILAALLVTGGGVGAAYVDKSEGNVFHWMYQDEHGAKIIITPQEEPETEDAAVVETENKEKVYYSVDEVPKEYQDWVTGIEGMSTLEGYELALFKTIENESCIEISCWMENEEIGNAIRLQKYVYRGKLQINYKKYDDLDLLYDTEVDGTVMQVFEKQDNSNGRDIVITFYYGNVRYCVSGKESVEAMEVIAGEYAGIVTKAGAIEE